MVILGMLALVAGACAQPTPPPAPEVNGTINVYVTDAPPREEVTSIMVTVTEVKVHRAVAEQEQEKEQSNSGDQAQEQEQEQQLTQQGEGEWISINLGDNATTFDLLEIRGVEQFLGTSEVTAGKYTQVRLVVDTIRVALGDGELEDAIVPSKELKLVRPFDVVAGETTALVLDFDADRMVIVTGAGKILVKPVIKLSVKHLSLTGEPKETEDEEVEDEEFEGTGADELAFEDTTWVLESYGETGDLNTVLEDTEISIEFISAEGKMEGSAGCNSYFGGYEVSEDKLAMKSPIGSTMMACPAPIMNQEQEYLTILQNAESYNIEGDQLQIVGVDKVLVFRRK